MRTTGCSSNTQSDSKLNYAFIYVLICDLKFSYLFIFIFPVKPKPGHPWRDNTRFPEQLATASLKVQKKSSNLPHTQIPVVCKSFTKFCLQTSMTHAHSYKTQVSEDFRSDFAISSWILVVCCLPLVCFQPPTQAYPVSYPAALSPSV